MLAAAGLAGVAMPAARVQAEINDDLVVHLRLDGNLQDSSGRGNHAVVGQNQLFFNPTSTNVDGNSRPPLIGTGSVDLTFGDAAEYIVLANTYADLQFGADTDFTVSLWTQRAPGGGNSDDAILIGNRKTDGYLRPGWSFELSNDPGSQWRGIFNGAPGQREDFFSKGDIAAGNGYHHLAATYDRDGYANYYEDGSLVASVWIAGSGSVDSGTATVIGQNADGNAGDKVANNFDDVGIWRRALSSAEIFTIASKGLTGVSLQDIPVNQQLLAGDINGDGATNQADYLVWNANVGFNNGTGKGDLATLAKGDADFNGIVNLRDFDVIATAANPPLNVPEPSGMLLACVGFVAVGIVYSSRLHRILMGVFATLFVLCRGSHSRAGVYLNEGFEGVTLEPAVNEGIPAEFLGWTDNPPAGWTVDDSHIPGVASGDDARDGRTEWAGWAFADKDWWVTADDQRRSEFSKGHGVVAIADPDEWDDQAHDPITDVSNTYSAYMATPTFSIAGARPGKLFLKFDSSFRPEGPDDGAAYNDQSPVIRASYNGGASSEILRWTSDPAAAMGGTVMREDNNTNDTVIVALTVPQGATTLKLDFGLERCENDWWWAIDNVVVADAMPEFKLVVDPVDGDVAIVNGSSAAVDLKGYTITSASGSLLPASWDSLQNTGDAGAGWLELVSPTTGLLTETNLNGSFEVGASESLYLGKAFKLAGSHDLAINVVDANGRSLTLFTEYDDFTPSVTPVGQDGDTDNDGDVDLDDLNAVRNNFGTTGTPGSTAGDAYPFDGEVNLDDLNAVRNNFGATAGANAVPEPGSFALLALAAFGGLGYGIRRRR